MIFLLYDSKRRFSWLNIWSDDNRSELNTLDHPDPATPRAVNFYGALSTQNATAFQHERELGTWVLPRS